MVIKFVFTIEIEIYKTFNFIQIYSVLEKLLIGVSSINAGFLRISLSCESCFLKNEMHGTFIIVYALSTF